MFSAFCDSVIAASNLDALFFRFRIPIRPRKPAIRLSDMRNNIGFPKIGFPKIGFPKIGFLKIGSLKIGSLKIGSLFYCRM